jgi:hypothetical protein
VLSRINPSVDQLAEQIRHRQEMVRMIDKPIRTVEDPFEPPRPLDREPAEKTPEASK